MIERLPYPGLRAYAREETDLFFGREGCVNEMVDRLAANRFLAVLGASGSGKSSLVRTGLLDGLELGLHAAAGPFWTVADLHPGGSPIRNLAAALLATSGKVASTAEIDTLEAFIRRGPLGIPEWVADGHLPPGNNLLVLVDQFEELFRYGDYAGREEAEAFVALLLEAARSNARIYVVITMRSEFLGACALIPGLAEQINRSLYLTRRMTREECRAAIEGPAAVIGFDIEPRLVTRLLNDLAGFAPWDVDPQTSQLQRLSRQADQLPLMQHALSRLWQMASQRDGQTRPVLTLKDYLAIGQIEGAVDRHAQAVMDGLSEPARALVPRIFRALVSGASLSDAVRRPLRFSDLVAVVGAEPALVTKVLDAFRAHGCNFLRPGEDHPLTDAAIIDISHESLIRQWRSLADWFTEEARSAALWNRLIVAEELHRAGEGEVLKGLDLANALAWWKRETPTRAWADAHGGNFSAVDSFLRRSAEAEEAQRRVAAERDTAEKRDLTRRNRIYAGLLAVCILGFGVAIAFFRMLDDTNHALAQAKALQESNNAMLARTNSNLASMTAAAEHARDRAEAALKGEAAANADSLDAAETFVVGFARQLSLTPGVSKAFVDSRLNEGRAFITKLETRMRDQRRIALTRAKFAVAAAGVLNDRGDYDNALATLIAAAASLAAHDTAELSQDEVLALAELRRTASRALLRLGRYADAEEQARLAVDLLARRGDVGGGDAILAMAGAELARATAQSLTDRKEEAAVGAKRCLELIGRDNVPDNTEKSYAAMQCHRLLTFAAWPSNPAESYRHGELTKEAFDRISPTEWTIPIVTDGAGAIGNLAVGAVSNAKDYKKARLLYLQAESLLRSFVSETELRTYPRVRQELVWLQNGVGETFAQEKNNSDASTWFEKAVASGLLDENWRRTPILVDHIDTAAANLSDSLDKLSWRSDAELLARREQAVRHLITVRQHLIEYGHARWCHSCLLLDRLTLFEVLQQFRKVRGEDRTDEAIKIANAVIEGAKAVLAAPPSEYDAINARRAWFYVVNQMMIPYEGSLKGALPPRLAGLEAARGRLKEFLERFPQSWRAEQRLGYTDALLAKLYLEAGRNEQAIEVAEEGASLYRQEAVALLAEWYRTGSGPVPQSAEKAATFAQQLAARNWSIRRYSANSVDYLWTEGDDKAAYNFDVLDPRSPGEDVVRRIIQQLEEIEGIRLSDSLKKYLYDTQDSARARNLSLVDLLAYEILGARGVSADDVVAGVKDRLAFADVDGAACRLLGWWKDSGNRATVREGLIKLIKEGLSSEDLRRASEAARFAPHALDLECSNDNTKITEAIDGKDLLVQVAVTLFRADWRDIAAAISEILLDNASFEPARTGSLFSIQGAMFAAAGETEKAEAALARALVLRPDDPEILNSLGYSWVERGSQLPSAIAMLQRAVALAPDNADIRDSLGWAYVTAGDAAKGLPMLESAAAADPDHAEIAAHVADTLRRLGRADEARSGFERAAQKPKSNEKIRTFIARQLALFEAEGDLRAAATLLNSVDPHARVGVSTDDVGVAIRGYDAVAYHALGVPVVGSVRHAVVWQGALWLFARAENRARFETEPERFAPAFGGFCASCAAIGQKEHADPYAWDIVEGKLYLHGTDSNHQAWRKEAARYIKDAVERWPALRDRAVSGDVRSPISERIATYARPG